MTFVLKGIVPPIVTPLNADETVDESGLERQLNRLIQAGVHGIYFLGSTGEQPALRDGEKVRAIRAARRVVNGRVPLVVGTMASGTARAVDNIRAAEKAGADAVAVTPPHYYPSSGAEEQLAHYRTCAAATGLPVVIYNIPSTTKVMLAPDTMARIGEIRNVVGLKDSSGDFSHFLKILGLLRDRAGFGCLVGSPVLAGAALLYGGDGAVPGVANVDPKAMLDVYAAAQARDLETLQRLQDRVHRLVALSSFGPNIVCLKTALELMGVCRAHTTGPLPSLAPDRKEGLARALRELELL